MNQPQPWSAPPSDVNTWPSLKGTTCRTISIDIITLLDTKMADPLSVVASIAGILAFAAKITSETITIVSAIRDAPDEITDLRFELQNLSSLVRSTHHLVSRNEPKPDGKPLEDTTTDCLQRCVTIVGEIQVKLQPFLSGDSGRRSPLPQSWSWVFHKAGIRTLKDRLRNSRAMLSLSVTVLTG